MRCCRATSTAMLRTAVGGVLDVSLRFRSRVVDADDPFGEKAIAADPTDGPLSSMKQRLDVDAFVTATAQVSANPTHFGPAWSQATTIGTKAGAALHRTTPLTNEELHALELERKQAAMSRNYLTYDDYLEHETSAAKPQQAAEEMESVVISADPNVSGYRVSQMDRRAERGDAQLRGADEDDGLDAEVPLPGFVTTSGRDCSTDAGDVRPPQDAGAEDVRCHGLSPHDPAHWGSEDVVKFLTTFADDGVMDASMVDAFQMMRVDGDMLLNKVVPNSLFKIMRRWHVKRKAAGNDATLEELRQCLPESISLLLVQETIYLCYPYCR